MSALPIGALRGQLPALLESPALYRENADVPAFEVKFHLSEAVAREVENQLRPRMALDPHADPALGNAYRVTSVYFDTPKLDVFHRTEGFRRRKFRIRRYGEASTVYLEQKTKSAQRVRKRRTSLASTELPSLAASNSAAWFVKRLTDRRLLPVCRVTYQRLALIGTSSEGPIRLTFDRAAQGERCDGPEPKLIADGKQLLHDEVITEFKFLGSMPSQFKSVVEGLRLTPMSVSKYRRCMEAVGPLVAGSS